MQIFRRGLIAGTLFLAAVIGFPATAGVDVALPGDVRIVVPDDSVPAGIKRFHGTWDGQWDGVLDHRLIVERVEASGNATVVYAWGDYRRWHVERGWIRTTATIAEGKMRLLRAGDRIEYVFRDDGALGGTYESRHNVNYGTFKRVGP